MLRLSCSSLSCHIYTSSWPSLTKTSSLVSLFKLLSASSSYPLYKFFTIFPGKIVILSMKFFKFLPARSKIAWTKTKESICLGRLTLSCCNKLALNWDFYFYGHWQISYNLVCWASATNVMIKLLLTVQYYESENMETIWTNFIFICVCV